MNDLTPEETMMIAQAMMRQNVISNQELLATEYTRKELGNSYPLIEQYVDLLDKAVKTPYLRAVVLGNLYIQQGKPYPEHRQAARREFAAAVVQAMTELATRASSKAKDLGLPGITDVLKKVADGEIKL